MAKFDLVIFDCDGVLVDSERLASQVWCQFLAEHDVHMTKEDLGEKYAGMTDAALAEAMRREHGVQFEGNVPLQIEGRCNILFDLELQAIDGVNHVIEKVDGLKCVCTNANLRRLERSLKMTSLIDYFNPAHLFYASMVNKPKPAPDLHLFAADKMGVAPERCLIIEDSVTGVTAGVDAGMTVYGFTGASHLGEAQAKKLYNVGATEVFSDMADVLDAM